MNSRSSPTRERILAVAERIVLQQGFNTTNIEDILQQAAITKSGFFYHFAGKVDLAKALVERYLKQDEKFFEGLFARADELTEDPLQQLLLFLKLLAEAMQNLESSHPGCLVVTFTYESYQLDEEISKLIQQGVNSWRNLISTRLKKIVQSQPLPAEVQLDDLADMFTACIEGGILFSRIFQNNNKLAQQILLYRDYLKRLFIL